MRFNAVSSFGIATLIVSVLISSHAFSQPEKVPPDVLELLPKGYVYADYPAFSTTLKTMGSPLRPGFI